MIFGYTIPEAKKTVIAALGFIALIVAMFVAYDPSLNDAVYTFAGSLIGVAGVFLAPQFSIEDLSKAVNALIGAAIAVANFFTTVDPSIEVKAVTIVGALVGLYTLYRANNEKLHNGTAA